MNIYFHNLNIFFIRLKYIVFAFNVPKMATIVILAFSDWNNTKEKFKVKLISVKFNAQGDLICVLFFLAEHN